MSCRIVLGLFLIALAPVACDSANLGSGGKVIQKSPTADARASGSGTGSTDKDVKIPVGGTTVPFTGEPVTGCKVENPKIASCDPKTGEIKGLAPGETVVHVTTPDGDKTVHVEVTPKGSGTSSGSGTSGSGDSGSNGSGGPGGGGTSGTTGTSGTASTGSGIDSGSKATGPTVTDDELIQQLPGVEVTKVGVNFEDLGPSGDHDYNDAVLCFQGHFKVDQSNIASIAAQTVVGSTFSHSGCNHTVRVEITHADGTKETPISFDSRAAQPVTMTFKVGSKMEVFMTPYKGCNEGLQHTMHEPDYARVQPNLCNQDGD